MVKARAWMVAAGMSGRRAAGRAPALRRWVAVRAESMVGMRAVMAGLMVADGQDTRGGDDGDGEGRCWSSTGLERMGKLPRRA